MTLQEVVVVRTIDSNDFDYDASEDPIVLRGITKKEMDA